MHGLYKAHAKAPPRPPAWFKGPRPSGRPRILFPSGSSVRQRLGSRRSYVDLLQLLVREEELGAELREGSGRIPLRPGLLSGYIPASLPPATPQKEFVRVTPPPPTPVEAPRRGRWGSFTVLCRGGGVSKSKATPHWTYGGSETVEGYDDVPRSEAEPVGEEALVERHEALGAPRLEKRGKQERLEAHFIL